MEKESGKGHGFGLVKPADLPDLPYSHPLVKHG